MTEVKDPDQPTLEKFYQDNIAQYQTPEQIRASHILLNTPGKDEATVRKQAEDPRLRLRKLEVELAEAEQEAKAAEKEKAAQERRLGRVQKEFDELSECDAIVICVPTPLSKTKTPTWPWWWARRARSRSTCASASWWCSRAPPTPAPRRS